MTTTVLSEAAPEAAPPVETAAPEPTIEAVAEVAQPTTQTATPDPVSFTDSLADDLKTDPAILKFSDINELAKGYKNLEKSVGAHKLSIPDEHSSPDDWNQLFHKLGNPKTLEEYQVDLPKESQVLDDEVVTGFKEVAHKVGVLPRQAQEILEWYNGFAENQLKDSEAATQTGSTETMEALKQEWGAGTNEKLVQAKSAVQEFGGQELINILNETGMGNNKVVIQAFAKVGALIAEDKVARGEVKRVETSNEMLDRAKHIIGDRNHAYNQKAHPNHTAARSEVEALYKLAYPEDA